MLTDKLYTVTSKDKDKITIKLCDENHPIFKAHFPNNPILPGFLHFDIVQELFNLEITTIKKAKFLKLVLPNDTLTYQKDKSRFKIFSQTSEVANFTL